MVELFSLGTQNSYSLKFDKEAYLKFGYWEDAKLSNSSDKEGDPNSRDIIIDVNHSNISANLPPFNYYENSNLNDVSLSISRVISYLEMSYLQTIDYDSFWDFSYYNEDNICSINYINRMLIPSNTNKITIPEGLQVLSKYGCIPYSGYDGHYYRRFMIDNANRLSKDFGYVDDEGISNFTKVLYTSVPIIAGMVVSDWENMNSVIDDGMIVGEEAENIISNIREDYESINAQTVIITGYDLDKEYLYILDPFKNEPNIITFDATKKLIFESYYLQHKPSMEMGVSMFSKKGYGSYNKEIVEIDENTGFLKVNTVFNPNDEFYLDVSLIKSSHLYIKNINPTGNLKTLFPLKKYYEDESTWLRYGRNYKFPYQSSYRFGGDTGEDYMVFIITQKKIPHYDLYEDEDSYIELKDNPDMEYFKENVFDDLISDYDAVIYVMRLFSESK
jgi:hypothetical protein